MEEKSIFQVLDFVINPKLSRSTPKGIILHYEQADPCISEILNNVLASQDEENHIIHIHDAAVFSAYFGIPRDEGERPSWDKLSFDEKICKIKNDFSHFFSDGGYTSFTKIL